MPPHTHTSALVFSLSSYDASTASLKSLSLVSQSSAYAARHRVFRVLKPIDIREVDSPGSLAHTLMQPNGWSYAYDVRSVTIILAKLSASRPRNTPSEEVVVADILRALPHLQHVKLVPDPSYRPQDFQPIAQALAQLTRLESLDIVDFHASSLSASTDTWARIGANLVALRVTVNQAERVENRRNPVFRTIIAHASHLRALELAGAQATRDVVQMLAALQHPENLIDLRLSLGAGQTVGSLASALNRLEQLEDLSITLGGGFESIYFLPEKNTFDRSVSTEALGLMGIQLRALRHLHLTCNDAALVSLGLGCAAPCACERCLPAAGPSAAAPYMRWLSPNDSKVSSSMATPFYWGVLPTPSMQPVDIHG